MAAHDAAAGALVPWLPGGVPFHEWEDEPMLRTYAAQRMQADGGLVFTHFQVGVCLAHTPLVDFVFAHPPMRSPSADHAHGRQLPTLTKHSAVGVGSGLG